MTDLEQVRTRYQRFADQECRGYSDHYFTLAMAVADDEELLEFIAEMPDTQPNLFLASIQFLAGPAGMPRTGTELRNVVEVQREKITHLMRSRRTQTNEVGRCAAILPALPRGPLALLEVGASAGLCLLLDKFHYDYGNLQVGDAASTVRLRCRTNEACPVPDMMPKVVWRGGLDLSPVNVMNAEDAKWLSSCVWPEHADRRERLAAAIALAQTATPLVRRGNLVSDLPLLLADVPRDLQLVVFHSAVLAYVSVEDRTPFAESLAEASRTRRIVWISNEGRTVIPEIATRAPLAAQTQPAPFLLGRTTLIDGERDDELLAFSHAHGAWLEWLSDGDGLQV